MSLHYKPLSNLNDIDIRKYIKSLNGFGSGVNKLVDEVNLQGGKARIDLLDLGNLEGWEIKGDNDSFSRLPNQIKVYNKCLPYVNVVVGNKHINKIKLVVPEFWGIYEVYQTPTLDLVIDQHREAKLNSLVDPNQMLLLLWTDELRKILREKAPKTLPLFNKRKYQLIKEVRKYVWSEDIPKLVGKIMNERTLWR